MLRPLHLVEQLGHRGYRRRLPEDLDTDHGTTLTPHPDGATAG